jgi:adenine-specific DNA glycosylase
VQAIMDEVATHSTNVRATNYGLLDIGALHCKPRPRCGGCPLSASCEFFLRSMRKKPAAKRSALPSV